MAEVVFLPEYVSFASSRTLAGWNFALLDQVLTTENEWPSGTGRRIGVKMQAPKNDVMDEHFIRALPANASHR